MMVVSGEEVCAARTRSSPFIFGIRTSVSTWRIDSSSSAIRTRRMHTVYADSPRAHASSRGCFLGRRGRRGRQCAHMSGKTVAIIGAGPAGLTAAYLLSKEGVPVTVIEADPELVGGIARTASYKGYHFDIGGHRFFSKSKEVEDLWTELLPNDLLERPRSSRIFYR